MWTYVFISLGHIGSSETAGSYVNSMFKPFDELPNYFLVYFTFLPAMLKDRSFFIYLPTSVVFYCFAYNHPSGCEVVSHFGFDLCFPDG